MRGDGITQRVHCPPLNKEYTPSYVGEFWTMIDGVFLVDEGYCVLCRPIGNTPTTVVGRGFTCHSAGVPKYPSTYTVYAWASKGVRAQVYSIWVFRKIRDSPQYRPPKWWDPLKIGTPVRYP